MNIPARWRMPILLGVLAVVAYLGYRWYENRNSSGSLGANLNSAAPELVGGSTGPASGLDYTQGTTVLDISAPSDTTTTTSDGDQTTPPPPPPPPPGKTPCPAIAAARCPPGEVRGPGRKNPQTGCMEPGPCIKPPKKKKSVKKGAPA